MSLGWLRCAIPVAVRSLHLASRGMVLEYNTTETAFLDYPDSPFGT
jgi:hypothetical protein